MEGKYPINFNYTLNILTEYLYIIEFKINVPKYTISFLQQNR